MSRIRSEHGPLSRQEAAGPRPVGSRLSAARPLAAPSGLIWPERSKRGVRVPRPAERIIRPPASIDSAINSAPPLSWWRRVPSRRQRHLAAAGGTGGPADDGWRPRCHSSYAAGGAESGDRPNHRRTKSLLKRRNGISRLRLCRERWQIERGSEC